MTTVEGVVLAAGLSSRLDPHKMTLPLGGSTVIERSVQSMYDVVARVLVVVGWNAERVRDLLASYSKVECVLNAAYRDGMFTSVKAGIAQVRAGRFFLLPGDHPLVGTQVYREMLAVQADIVVPTFGGTRGHPVLLSSHLIPEILACPDHASLREVIERRGYVAVEVQDEGILLDVDTAAEYEMACTRLETTREGNR